MRGEKNDKTKATASLDERTKRRPYHGVPLRMRREFHQGVPRRSIRVSGSNQQIRRLRVTNAIPDTMVGLTVTSISLRVLLRIAFSLRISLQSRLFKRMVLLGV